MYIIKYQAEHKYDTYKKEDQFLYPLRALKNIQRNERNQRKQRKQRNQKISSPPFFLVSIKQTGFVQTNCQINEINEINCVNNFFDGNGKLKSWLTIIHEYNVKKN